MDMISLGHAISCTFEDASMCGYKNTSSRDYGDDDRLWELVASSLQSRPNLDHTIGVLREGVYYRLFFNINKFWIDSSFNRRLFLNSGTILVF